MEIDAPYSWINKVENALIELDEIPLFGTPPSFNWEEFTDLIARQFGIENLEIDSEEMMWRSRDEFHAGMGEMIVSIPIALSPLKGHAFWIMDQEDVKKITSWTLSKSSKPQTFSSTILEEGFYRYLLLEALQVFEQMDFVKGFSPKVADHISSDDEGAFCIDVHLTRGSKSSWGRLCLSPHFRKSYKEYYASASSRLPFSKQNLSLDVTVHADIGIVTMSAESWKKANKGDFVILDRSTYDPRKNKGTAELKLGSTPLFQVGLREDQLVIVDYALYYEGETSMEDDDDDELLPQAAPAGRESFSVEEEVTPAEEMPVESIKNVPLAINVEVGRFRISLKKLMQLKPGNFIELAIHPEQGVNLTVNGKKIGRGELVFLGDVLGVRILDLGK